MYHRVARAEIDPWGLAVAPDVFDEQMAVLARTRRPVSLDWLARELKAGRNPARAVSVTFDDAYRDVLEHAKPSLVRHGIPATVFVVWEAVGSPRGYWWDELADLVLGATAIPSCIPLPNPDPEVEAARASGDRQRLHLALWRVLRALPKSDRTPALEALSEAYGTTRPATAPVMKQEELLALMEGGRIDLGVHTLSHPPLPSLSCEAQAAEIAGCKVQLERLTGKPNRRLAYPFGDYDERSTQIARDLGFDYAVSVNSGPVTGWGQRFELPRNDVKNWKADAFARRLQWFG